jgi:hypothetical protein
MKTLMLFGLVMSQGLATGCASHRAQAPDATMPSLVGDTYNHEQLVRIMDLREQGESLAAVAKIVGGTRADVRAAERQQKTRQQADRRHANLSLVVASCCR